MANRAGRADSKFGHTNTAYGNEAFNLEDPAFQKGLENANFEWPQAADGETVDAGYGDTAGRMQQGRFGGSSKVYPSGTAESITDRMKDANDPKSAKSPTGTKNKRY